MDIGIGRDRRAHVSANGRRIDKVRASNPLGINPAYMARHALACCLSFEGRNERLEYKRGLTRARNTRDRRQTAARDINFQGFHRMDRTRHHANVPMVEQLVFGD